MSEQWSQEMIDRLIPDLHDRLRIVTMIIHARDYLRGPKGEYFLGRINAIELLGDGVKNILDSHATGLEWWTLRHRLSDLEIQSGSWMDRYKTSWMSAREAEIQRNGKQR